ncbi:uncharacterized protein LOC111252679 [Varroa destructor]|uniref:R3H domain-containing protein n=1 Tax=Varroa destructor TaxID=109461 RepID=A0A7M7KGZ8_VARDE|nr:uncharacterized protein LOC111252679 [Varroa destructor]
MNFTPRKTNHIYATASIAHAWFTHHYLTSFNFLLSFLLLTLYVSLLFCSFRDETSPPPDETPLVKLHATHSEDNACISASCSSTTCSGAVAAGGCTSASTASTASGGCPTVAPFAPLPPSTTTTPATITVAAAAPSPLGPGGPPGPGPGSGGPGPAAVVTVGPPPPIAVAQPGPVGNVGVVGIGVPVGVGVGLNVGVNMGVGVPGGAGAPPHPQTLPLGVGAVGLQQPQPPQQQQPTPAIHVIGVLGGGPTCDAALCDNNGPVPAQPAMRMVDVQPLAPLGATAVTTAMVPDCGGPTGGGAPGGGNGPLRPGVQLTGQLTTAAGQVVVTTAGVAGSPSPDGAGSGKELLGVGAPAVNVICASPNISVNSAHQRRHKFHMGYLTTWSGGSQGSSSVESSSTWPLSRDSSTDTASFTDSTGTDLEAFIVETLHKNHKERSMMLRLEQDLIALLNDQGRTSHKFSPMTSYHRMIVHRCAAFFGLDHNVDTSGQSVIVSKTKHSRVPERRFQEYLNSPPLELYSTGRTGGPDSRPSASCQPHWTSDPAMLSVKKLNILKRDNSKEKDDKDNTSGRTCWLSDGCGNKAFHGLEGRRCRSMEEREEHYNLVRERIFKGGSLDDRATALSTSTSPVDPVQSLLPSPRGVVIPAEGVAPGVVSGELVISGAAARTTPEVVSVVVSSMPAVVNDTSESITSIGISVHDGGSDPDNPSPSSTSTSATVRPSSEKDNNGLNIAVEGGSDTAEKAKEIEEDTTKRSAPSDSESGRQPLQQTQQLPPQQQQRRSESSTNISPADQLSVSMQNMAVQEVKKDEVRSQPSRTRDHPQPQQQYNNSSSSNNNSNKCHRGDDQQHHHHHHHTHLVHAPHSQGVGGGGAQTHNGPAVSGGSGRHHGGSQGYHHNNHHHVSGSGQQHHSQQHQQHFGGGGVAHGAYGHAGIQTSAHGGIVHGSGGPHSGGGGAHMPFRQGAAGSGGGGGASGGGGRNYNQRDAQTFKDNRSPPDWKQHQSPQGSQGHAGLVDYRTMDGHTPDKMLHGYVHGGGHPHAAAAAAHAAAAAAAHTQGQLFAVQPVAADMNGPPHGVTEQWVHVPPYVNQLTTSQGIATYLNHQQQYTAAAPAPTMYYVPSNHCAVWQPVSMPPGSHGGAQLQPTQIAQVAPVGQMSQMAQMGQHGVPGEHGSVVPLLGSVSMPLVPPGVSPPMLALGPNGQVLPLPPGHTVQALQAVPNVQSVQGVPAAMGHPHPAAAHSGHHHINHQMNGAQVMSPPPPPGAPMRAATPGQCLLPTPLPQGTASSGGAATAATPIGLAVTGPAGGPGPTAHASAAHAHAVPATPGQQIVIAPPMCAQYGQSVWPPAGPIYCYSALRPTGQYYTLSYAPAPGTSTAALGPNGPPAYSPGGASASGRALPPTTCPTSVPIMTPANAQYGVAGVIPLTAAGSATPGQVRFAGPSILNL